MGRRELYARGVGQDTPLDRAVWTDADYETMGWHDVAIHGIAFEDDGASRLLLDLDYIVEWLCPVPPSKSLAFLVTPATLIFENVWGLEGAMRAASAYQRVLLLIDSLKVSTPSAEQMKASTSTAGGHDFASGFPNTGDLRAWEISGQNFELTFLADGYHQHFRAHPINVTRGQRLTSAQRGGISFAEPAELPQ